MENQENRAPAPRAQEASQTHANPTDSTPASEDDAVRRAPRQPPQVGFQRFPDLPAELRAAIFQLAAREDMRAVRTVGTNWDGREGAGGALAVQTAQAHRYPAGLRHASREARGEAARACASLPTRLVTDPGANVISAAAGAGAGGWRLRRVGSRHVGARPFHAAATTFFMDEATAAEVFGLLRRGALRGGELGWLGSVMLDKRAFQHLLGPRLGDSSSSSSSDDGGGAGGPFALLPGLGRIVVGFLRRFQDVAVLEGRYDDVVTEVQVVEDPGAADEAFRWVVRSPYELHPMLELMVVTAARQTRADVDALARDGIDVVWAVIEGGITRRPDIFEGFVDG